MRAAKQSESTHIDISLGKVVIAYVLSKSYLFTHPADEATLAFI